MKSVASALALSAFAMLGCTAELNTTNEANDTPTTATQQQAVQTDHREADVPRFEYSKVNNRAARSTGALHQPYLDDDGNPRTSNGFPVRSTCGVTFVSPTFAVTAAHCVRGVNLPDPDNDSFIVEQFDISSVSDSKLANAEHVKGNFPYFTRSKLSAADGYSVTRYNNCYVRRRCAYGKVNCDFDADVALIECVDRPASAEYMPVAASDPLTGPVETYWFHEVLDVALEWPEMPAPPLDHWVDVYIHERQNQYEHYTQYSSDVGSNYHYLGGDRNQLLPLHSVNFPGNVKPRRLFVHDKLVWTDLFGCHGTSGSGVFQENGLGDLEYLGPVTSGERWANTFLCAESGDRRDRPTISYTQNQYVRRLVDVLPTPSRCSAFNPARLSASFCNDPFCPCQIGEGDCDYHWQCSGDLVCGRDNGPTFGLPYKWDACVSPVAACGNGQPDKGEICDDGNTTSGDGCSPGCAPEPGWTCQAWDHCYRSVSVNKLLKAR